MSGRLRDQQEPSRLQPAVLLARLLALRPVYRRLALEGMPDVCARGLLELWAFWAHGGQVEPPGDWRVWLIRAGRGFGKTRTGAEWVSEVARTNPTARIALVAATIAEGRRVMIEGPSGLIAVQHGHERLTWRRARGEVAFESGATAYLFSAEAPQSLRGPQHDAAWCDELAKWRYGDAAWDNLVMGLRAGDRPRVVVTTTPAPEPLMRKVMALSDCRETRGTTHENPHLPDAYVAAMEAHYGGSRLGRQELEGELLEDHEGALWTRALVEAARVDAAPDLRRVVVAVDPPASATGDACGIVAVGLGEDDRAYVLEDASVAGLSPGGWARAVAACAARHGADRVVAEKNQGGDMVAAVLRQANDAMPVRLVHASRGKVARAEPVAAWYEAGKVKHVGILRALEDELCGLVVGGVYRGPGRSPDRADALVWGVSELMGKRGRAGVRSLGAEPSI